MNWHALKKEAVIKELNTSLQGLTEKEAETRLEKYGENIIKETYKISPIKIFFSQFKSFLIYILLAAIIISVIIKHFLDASVIFAIVILNASLGFIQQYRAEKSILKLRQIFIPKAKVFREGKLKKISSRLIVPGDIIIYEEGDKVLADSRILQSEYLEVNEAILTGESSPVEKYDTIVKLDGILSEELNMLFSGTTIVKGNVKAIVTETGMQTEFGKIALKLQEIKLPETPMQKKLDKFSKQITFIVLIIAAIIFILGITQGKDKIEMFLTSIALVVSVIPEGLPAIITISLAFATKNMLRNNVLVRRLPATETLGSVTVICVPGETPIICNPSLKTIDSVTEGDKVLGLDGNFHNVIKTYKRNYSGRMIHIKPLGLPLLKITPEHPVLIAKIKRHRPLLNLNGIKSRPRETEILKPEWIKASEVKEGDFVAIPRIKEENQYKFKFRRGRSGKEIELSLDEELAELLGWYLAEGCCSINKGSYHIIFYLNKKEKENIERVKHLIENKLGLKTYLYQNRTAVSIIAINKDLVNFLRESFGDRAINKKLPEFILSAKKQVINKFLLGYLKGDGNVSNYYIRFVTVSKTLSYQLIILLAKLGIRCRLHERKGREGFIEGRKVNIHKSYELFINGSQSDLIHPVKINLKERKKNLSLFDEYFVYVPIRKITNKQESLEVFNIETKSNTYALPFIVHNCSDKTGTMTKEKMFVTDIFCNNKFFRNTPRGTFLANKRADLQKEKELFELIKTSILSSNARFEETSDNQFQIIGDPTESAFVSFALDLGIDKKILSEIEPRIKEISFSSERKMMSILRKSIRRNVLYAKGSTSSILEKSSFEFKKDGIYSLNARRKEDILKITENFERKGLRVLAFAYKYTLSEKELESGLIFVGLVGMLDPPRPEVKEAIKLCKEAGIKVKMITGDSLLTARTVGKEIGIEGKIIGGRELQEMSDEELSEEIDKIVIFARTEPQQKFRIVEILSKRGEQVAITGDGVNDILALKRADIGIAMGKRGSDVARDVSDMILLDDNFASIIKGIEQGRIVYDNTKKATKFLLASNFGEALLIIYSLLFSLPLPLLPLQILWINLVTDAFPALALTTESGEEVMKTKPRKETSILNGIFLFVLAAGIISLIAGLVIFYSFYQQIEKARTMVMFSLIGFEVFFVFSCRSDKSLKEIGFFSNKYIFYAIFSIIILQLILILTPLSSVFGVVKLTVFEWLLVLLASLPGLVVFEIAKYFRKKKD